MQIPGTWVISAPDTGDIAFASNPSVYAFDRPTVRCNLYRIPVPDARSPQLGVGAVSVEIPEVARHLRYFVFSNRRQPGVTRHR